MPFVSRRFLFLSTQQLRSLFSAKNQSFRSIWLTTRNLAEYSKRRLSSKMRGAVVREFGGPEVIQLDDNLPVPTAGERQVLVRVKAAGVNPVDTYIRSGTYGTLPELPYVLGREGAGIVEQVGPGVEQFEAGDRVWFSAMKNGASAEYIAIDVDHVFKLPDRVSFAQGASLGIAYITAYRALFVKAFAQAGQSVLVHGASGGVGLASCHLAKVHGLRVYGTASTPEGQALAKQHGCEEVFNHREPDYIDQIRQKAPQGFDIILEMLANVNLCNDLQLLALQGRVIVVGNRGKINDFDPRECMKKETSIIGVAASLTTPIEFQGIGERMNALLEGGHISPNVGKTFPLEQIAETHRLIVEPGARGKIVILLEPDDDSQKPTPDEPQQ